MSKDGIKVILLVNSLPCNCDSCIEKKCNHNSKIGISVKNI